MWERQRARVIQRVWAWASRAGAIGADDPVGRRFRRFGRTSCLSFPTGAVYGEAHIEIGEDTILGPYVSVSAGMAVGQDLGDATIIRIGDRVRVGRGSHIVGHHSITIDDDVITGPYVYITDQNHVYADVDVPVSKQWPSNEAVRIGAGSWLGTGCVVLPGTTLGRNVVVAANSVVKGDIPDHAVVAGVPGKIVRRHTAEGWDPPLRDVEITPPEGYDPRA